MQAGSESFFILLNIHMTTREKVANQFLVKKETDTNKLTDSEAKEYALELEQELYNIWQLSTQEIYILNTLEDAQTVS